MVEKCRKCLVDRQDGDKFCASCGTEFDKEVSCQSCGKSVLAHQTFCTACGVRTQPTEYEQVGSGLKEIFLKVFPNLCEIRPEPKSRYWTAVVVGGIAAGTSELFVTFILSVAIGSLPIALFAGWIVKWYVLIRFYADIYMGRVLDLEPSKQEQIGALGWIIFGLSILGIFSPALLAISYVVGIGTGIYLGVLPSCRPIVYKIVEKI